MKRDPVYLEQFLTRDYVDRAEKLRQLQERSEAYPPWLDLVATWLVLVGLLICVWVAW